MPKGAELLLFSVSGNPFFKIPLALQSFGNFSACEDTMSCIRGSRLPLQFQLHAYDQPIIHPIDLYAPRRRFILSRLVENHLLRRTDVIMECWITNKCAFRNDARAHAQVQTHVQIFHRFPVVYLDALSSPRGSRLLPRLLVSFQAGKPGRSNFEISR